MKIGILTFHISRNYGAVLQCFALQNYLQSLGHCVEIVDYRPKYLVTPYKATRKFQYIKNSRRPFLLQFALWCIDSIKNYVKRTEYIAKFNNFESHYLNISNSDVYKDIVLDYDYCITGSDQVWNPLITNGLDRFYWGGGGKSSSKKITYAASSSFYDFTNEQKISIHTYLGNFHKLSVREIELQNYLKRNFNIESTLVCDPTQLIDRDCWSKIAIKPKIEKYLLVYFSEPKTLQVASEIAKRRGLRIVPVFNIYSNSAGAVASPEEFVGLFKYADFVVSSSFHGLSFSLIFKRDFCIIGRGADSDSRLLVILRKMGLENRLIYKSSDVDQLSTDKIDYNTVHLAMDKFQQESREYLIDCLTSN